MGVFTKKCPLCCGGCKSGGPVVCSNRAEAVPGGLKPTEKMPGNTLKVPSHFLLVQENVRGKAGQEARICEVQILPFPSPPR